LSAAFCSNFLHDFHGLEIMDKEKLQLVVGKLLVELRKEAGISQEKLAELTDLERSFISLIERGKRRISLLTLFKLAEAFNMKASEIIIKTESKL
jgi:transcriptional regulator with XRE-family HTH domain